TTAMSTEFISFQPAPGKALEAYDPTLPPTAQPSTVPPIFLEAMAVRTAVFVEEQHVPATHELDADDARSYHWVVYASVGVSSSTQPPPSFPNAGSSTTPTASRLPVGTIRLVPPPHANHGEGPVRPHSSQPYVKLGRLAVLKPYRGLGLSRLLVQAAVEWARRHPREILVPPTPAEVEAMRLEGKEEPGRWEGKVVVHAQVGVQKVWERMGFVRDEGMGVWVEEGIEHVGMWKNVGIVE
ncbi:acetyltransferase, GNAT family, partial [Trichodelitschia bisporula]